jgi:pyruvate carboxylase
VSRYYDSLLSKVISSAPTFDKAVQRMARALQEFQVSRPHEGPPAF